MSIKRRLKDVVGYVATTGVTTAIAYGLAKWAECAANANVRVRPELAQVDFWTAFLAQHGQDWLFYHYPGTMEKAYVGCGILAGEFLYLYLYLRKEKAKKP